MDFVIVVRQGWLSQMERARLRCRPVCMAEWLELEMNLTWFSRFGFLLRLPYDDKVFQTHNWKLVNWAHSVWLLTNAGKVPDFLSFECNIAFGLCVTNILLLSLNVWHFIKNVSSTRYLPFNNFITTYWILTIFNHAKPKSNKRALQLKQLLIGTTRKFGIFEGPRRGIPAAIKSRNRNYIQAVKTIFCFKTISFNYRLGVGDQISVSSSLVFYRGSEFHDL